MSKNGQFDKMNSISMGEFTINLASERIFKNDDEIKVEPQIFACLALLISSVGQVISRDEIQKYVWAGRYVSDEAIRAAFKKLRHVLGDDARNPLYIKTVPKQGYKLIAEVTQLNQGLNKDQQSLKQTIFKFSWLIILFTVIAVLFVNINTANKSLTKGEDTRFQPDFNITKLTQLAGSEIYASYHSKTQKIAFSHRSNSDSPQQIFIKNTLNQQLQQISRDGGHYTDVHWSQNGKRLALTRNADQQTVILIVEFDNEGNILEVNELNNSNIKDMYVVGWSENSSLFLAQEKYAAANRSIFKVDIKGSQLTQVTSPKVGGSGDFLAAESLDGNKLAIIREVANREFSLLVIDSATGTLLANRVLPMFPNRVIWHKDNNTLTMSSFKGLVTTFDTKQNRLKMGPKFPAYTNDVFAECGERCYFMRMHNGNYLDIQEQPIPIKVPAPTNELSSSAKPSNTKKGKVDQSKPKLVAGEILALPGSQDFPTYSSNLKSIYFATYTSQALLIEKKTIAGELTVIACWPADLQLDALRINSDETYLAAIINNRLVVQPIVQSRECVASTQTAKNKQLIAVSEPDYKTSALETVANPLWHNDNKSLYLTTYEDGDPNVIHMDLLADNRTQVVSKYLSYQPFNGVQGYKAVAVDQNRIAWLIKDPTAGEQQSSDEHASVKLARLDAINSHRWVLTNDGLYFSVRKGREAILNAVFFDSLSLNGDFTEKVLEQSSLGHNRFRLNFDLHPAKQKILLVESLSAESDLVKVTW